MIVKNKEVTQTERLKWRNLMDRLKRIQWLKERHQQLHRECEESPSKDLKKEKLLIKDEIERLQYNPDEHQGGVENFR